MFRTSYASLRVPDLDDTDMVSATQALMADIQYRLEQNQARVNELKRRRGTAVTASGSQAISSATLTTVQFATERYDTDSYFDSTISLTNFTVQRGLYLVSFQGFMSAGAVINTAYCDLVGSVAGTFAYNQVGPFASTTTATVSVISMLRSEGSQTVTARLYQHSGTAGTIVDADLEMARIGNY